MRINSITLSLTKIVIPTLRPEVLSRERLLTRLDDLLDQKLVLINAPAGFGKTSLLIDLAHHTEMPICWLSLDGLDRDPQRFIAYFIAAISQRFPRFGNQSNSALNSLTSLEQGLENLIITLVNEIYERVSEHFVFVMDDYQFVDGVPEIRDFVSRFIQLASENCHLILSSRRLPTLPDMAILVARQQVGGFDLQELAFQRDEIHTLFEKKYGLHLTDETVDELFLHTEGWITGLHLSKPRTSHGVPDLTRAAHAADVSLLDYLDQQVLGQQTPEVRTFLLQTSLFDEFDAELCAAVLGGIKPDLPRDWKKLIETVKRSNLFVLPVGPHGKWLRYHHLFQDFLQSHLQEENPDLARTILVNLAQYYEEYGEWEKAHYVYQQLGDFSALAGLVERAGTSLIQNDRYITLANWLDNLPEVLVQERPGLLSLKGAVAQVQGQVIYGLSLLNQAEVVYRTQGDKRNLALTLVRRAWANRLAGNYSASIVDAEETLQITKRSRNTYLQSIRADALRMKGLGLYRLGDVKQSVKWFELSLSLFSDLKVSLNVPRVLMELGMVHRAIGDYQRAKEFYRKALEIWEKQGNLSSQAHLLNSLGVLHHALGEYEQAASAFERGLDCARRSGYRHAEALLLTSLGDMYMELGEYEIARHAYEMAEVIARQAADKFLLTYSLLSQAGVARATASFDRAHRLLEEVRIPIKGSNSSYERGLYELECGRLELYNGNPQRAAHLFRNAVELFSHGNLILETGWSRLWLAAAYNQLGDQQSVGEQIKEVRKVEGHPSHSLSMAAFQVRRWLDSSLFEDPETKFALTRLMKRAEQVQARLAPLRKRLRHLTSTVPMPPPHLDIKAFGKAQVWVNGKLVTKTQWQSKSVRELFFYFLNVNEALTKEQVGEDFWQEVTPGQLKLRFKNNIYRLRRALGPASILWEKDSYRFNRDLDYEYDVEIFKTSLNKARSAKDIQEQIYHYQEAVNLVQGPYLDDLDSTWVLPEREFLEQEYLMALLKLAKLFLQVGEIGEALAACQRALAWDSCFEEAHRLAMQIYDRMGDHIAVSRQYQVCRKTLKTELGLVPSPETEELYKQLIP